MAPNILSRIITALLISSQARSRWRQITVDL